MASDQVSRRNPATGIRKSDIQANAQSTLTPSELAKESAAVRRDVLEALFACGGGHYGGSMSVVDILVTLYRQHVGRRDAHDRDRDRLILSKGHAAVALYAVQRRLGLHSHPLSDYARHGSPLQGHPDVTRMAEVEFSTGSLGQGLAAGVGMALALRGRGPRVWVVLGDGECQEGAVWEAAMLAARYRLDNLTAIVDANGFQEWGHGDGAPPVPDLPLKLASFGWSVLEVDGHDHAALSRVLAESARLHGRPSAVIAETVKGKGVAAIESDPVRFHCSEVSAEEHQGLLASLS